MLEAKKGAKTGRSEEEAALKVLQLKGRSEGGGRRGRERGRALTSPVCNVPSLGADRQLDVQPGGDEKDQSSRWRFHSFQE